MFVSFLLKHLHCFQFSIAKIDGLCFGQAPFSSKTQLSASHVQPSPSFVASKRSRAMFFLTFLGTYCTDR